MKISQDVSDPKKRSLDMEGLLIIQIFSLVDKHRIYVWMFLGLILLSLAASCTYYSTI